jgi:excinuclease ABC subunit A
VYVPCEVCKGARYNRETLEVHYKGRTISEVLEMPIEEASTFFEAIPAIHRHLSTLVDVGLGYVRLGQPAPTLSGGEAQRVKLASELQKRSTGRTVYVLDEPTTGLHFEDIRKLLTVLESLVDKGNTVIVIEHNLDVIKTADWIIDMGPSGGHRGGLLIAAGTPEEIAEVPESATGEFLRNTLGLTGPPKGSDKALARAAKSNGGNGNGKAAAGKATAETKAADPDEPVAAATGNGRAAAGNGRAASGRAKTVPAAKAAPARKTTTAAKAAPATKAAAAKAASSAKVTAAAKAAPATKTAAAKAAPAAKATAAAKAAPATKTAAAKAGPAAQTTAAKTTTSTARVKAAAPAEEKPAKKAAPRARTASKATTRAR